MNTEDAVAEISRLDASAEKLWTAFSRGKMRWRRWGKGPSLVLIHGGAGSWLHWIRNIERLALTHTVWVPDIPGFGDSDFPGEGYDADTLAPLVQLGIDELLGIEHYDLVGFSFGALVCGFVAAKRPAGLGRLVLVGANGLGLTSILPKTKSLRGALDDDERKAAWHFNLNAVMIHDPSQIDELAILIQSQVAPKDLVKNRKLILTDVLLSLAKEWSAPAYGIWGAKDVVYRDQLDRLKATMARLPLSRAIIVPDAGHWVQFERADEFNRLLSQILQNR